MANTNTPSGLRPVRHRNGAPYTGSGNRYFVPASDATALFLGDPVQIAGSADADGVATVTRATAAGGNFILGAVVAFDPVDGAGASGRDSPVYRAVDAARYAYVEDDPDVVFEIQEDAIGGALAVADIGLNADLISGVGSTVTGRSAFQLDTSTKATTATLQLRILGFGRKPDNEVGNANAKVEVAINLHQFRNTTGI
jgi:hypothetical protein